MGEDEQLAAHYDNSEVTLNVNLGLEFEGGPPGCDSNRLLPRPRAHDSRPCVARPPITRAGSPLGPPPGELVFHGRRGSSDTPRPAFHEWEEVGGGVLHLGQHVHSALPITEGERLNFVMWMRSARWRRTEGCPMCDRTDGLFGYG